MNKMLLFPMALMLILSMYGMIYTGYTYTPDSTEDYSNTSADVDGDPTYVDIPEAGSYTFDVWDNSGFLLILTAAIAIGVIAGVNFLGSGLSDTSQKMLFDSVLFGGIWACLSVAAVDFMFVNTYTSLLWLILTMVYIIGVGSHMTQAD